jgi:hypothetical protein
MLDATHTTGNLTMTAPQPYSVLSFLLANAAGSAANNVGVTINYAGGGTQTASLTSPDWFNVNSGIAIVTAGRGNTGLVFNNVNSNNPRLYQADLLLTDQLNNVLSIDFTFQGTGGQRTAIFGISGTPVPEPSTMALVSVGAVGFLVRRFRRGK